MTTKQQAGDEASLSLMEGAALLASANPYYYGRLTGEDHTSPHCRRPLIQLPGTGKPRFELPPSNEVIQACVDAIAQIAQVQRERARQQGSTGGDEDRALGGQEIQSVIDGECCRQLLAAAQKALSEPAQASPSPLELMQANQPGTAPVGRTNATLWVVIGGINNVMWKGRYEAHIANLFDPLSGVVEWARKNAPENHQFVVESLDEHCKNLIELTREVLPSVVHAVAAQYPKASEEQWINAAVQLLSQQLAEPLYILDICLDSWRQQRDGKYDQLPLLEFVLSQNLKLFNARKTQTLHTGDVFLPHFSPDGPSTIPGAKGPIAAHVVQVPHDERAILVLMMLIYLHEFRHNYFADVEGLPEQMAAALVKAIDRDYAAGKFKFTSETINIGKKKVRTIDLLRQICVQTLSENDADVAAILLGGPAFSKYSMIPVFGAFNCRSTGVFDTNTFLRNRNYFQVTKKGELVFAPHMPDFPRAYVVGAAAIKALGFADQAQECRDLAVQAAGEPVPKKVIWLSADREGPFKDLVIEVPLADLDQLGDTVADAIINSVLDCLGGMSTRDQVNWTVKDEELVKKLAEVIVKGGTEIPADILPEVHCNHVSSGVAMANWNLCEKGVRAVRAAMQAEAGGRKMLGQLRKLVAEKEAAAVAAVAAAVASTPPSTAGEAAK
ncbi:MAG: hypothetical protein K2W82_14240 [Candidatus Obscuribacterales bacterium]|nr:hypothetical protein [Candidatus Obscuribacterales bacterium]